MSWNVRKYHYSSCLFGGRFVILGEYFVFCFFDLYSYLKNLIIHSRDFSAGSCTWKLTRTLI